MILPGLAVFAGLSLNLILQFAIGTGAAGKGNDLPVFQTINIFISVMVLWILHTYLFSFFSWEFAIFFLFFPFSVLVCLAFENLETRLFAKNKRVRLFSGITAYEGLIPASLILTVNTALNFFDAVILSFFFASGCLIAVICIREIRRRCALEEIPAGLRGMPLVLVSMGLLSMIFSTAAWICYRVLYNL